MGQVHELCPGSGFFYVRGFLPVESQRDLLEAARTVCADAPLRRPTLTNGTPLKLTLTNCGSLGWWADRDGYRYIDRHPTTQRPWPAVPEFVLRLARLALEECGLPPMRVDNCLINHYAEGESLGMHVDRTEQDKRAPIISLSVGADAEFILEDPDGKKWPLMIGPGDLVVQSGRSRGWLHGIKRILPTMPNLCRDGGRLNFTMRKVLSAVAEPVEAA